MVLKDLMAISGNPGLYKFIAQGKNAVIVENLETGKRTSAHAAAKISSLEYIAVFTETEEVPLSEVFDRIYEKEEGAEALSHKSPPEELKSYFAGLLPEYDRERVYLSDIRKIIQWYNILKSLDMLQKEEEGQEPDKGKEEKEGAEEEKKAASKGEEGAEDEKKAASKEKKVASKEKKGAEKEKEAGDESADSADDKK
jgi:hypothetical protein